MPDTVRLFDSMPAIKMDEVTMAARADFEVMLNGDPQDLRELSERVGTTEYFHIWGGVDHWNDCPSDYFSFNSIYFEGEDDENLIWQISYELSSLFNGASKLFWRDARPITIHKILLEGKPLDWHEPMMPLSLLRRPAISQYKWNEEVKCALRMSARLGLMILATENEDVYMLLKQFELENSWVGYYRLLETIDSHARVKGITIGEDKKERESFTFTANNYSITGFDSRHGFKDKVKASRLPVMKIDQGYAFVTKMCKSYLDQAYAQFFKFG
ncbi:hypothetical protein [Pseudomonas nunensis]|uniref:Uncharacterized protein n=2 Tax=Pseudomonas TaxID=286 RepID=A0ABY5EIQ7_9PSED|nr:hypothetical protein [Pseudomonas nunensis]KPN94096.1 hypothetical protein AL066_04325 [Pseudomonas nunensis]MCL5230605.1 hypothetical protein [Pseudomonas nunensis]UTO15621.1 hypothetical protein NK667_04445 [Pseudomonas nunensis]